MTWVKLDDTFPTNPKVDGLTADAFRLYVEGLCYCAANLTDGTITARALRRLWDADPGELVNAGLWTAQGDGYVVNDYLEFNPSREKVLAERSKRAEAGRKGAQVRWGDGTSHITSHSSGYGTPQANRIAPDPSRPHVKTRSPVDNSRPALRAVEEIIEADRVVNGAPVPSTAPAAQEALAQARRAMKGAK